MATLITLVDGTVPVAADYNSNWVALNTEARGATVGGTGIAAYSVGDVLYASATNTLSARPIGTRGQVLAVGASSLPTWQTAPVPGFMSRLAGSRTNATTVNVTADYLTLVNASGHPVTVSAVNVSPAITASGANGLDSGSEANATGYYIWVIYDGSTVAGLLSVASTIGALTFPGAHTFARLVGWVYNDGSGNLVPYSQKARRIDYAGDSTDGPRNVFTNTTGVTSFTSVSIAAFIPAARVVKVFGIGGGDQAGATSGMAVSPNSGGEYSSIALGDSTGSTVMMGWAGAWPWEIVWLTGTDLYWRASATTATAFRLGIRGFEMDL